MVALPQTQTKTTQPTDRWVKGELIKCKLSPLYFVDTYCYIYDAVASEWVPFKLWDAQAETLRAMWLHRLLVVLKARQIGMTWLALAFALWLMLFWPAATILLFSRRDDEAIDLLDVRLKGMYDHLPAWMKVRAVAADSKHEWALSNGSRAKALPTTGGDSYTATLVIGDEFDIVTNQDHLMRSVKPTIADGGRMILLSRPDKGRPNTRFKREYRAAKAGKSGWHAVFLPWYVRPGRDQAWYDAEVQSTLEATGSLDDVQEQYPATDVEALAPRTLQKRIAPAWLHQCYRELEALELPEEAPSLPDLVIFHPPHKGQQYVIGVDPAEGNPTSDDSALNVLCRETGEQAAELRGKFQPTTLAAYADQIGQYFNRADVMVERNNHGHSVIAWLEEHSKLTLLKGHDEKEGWLSSVKGKVLLYDIAADAFRHLETTLHSFLAFTQLSSIDGSTLRAPEGEMDDVADSYALALAGVVTPGESTPDYASWGLVTA